MDVHVLPSLADEDVAHVWAAAFDLAAGEEQVPRPCRRSRTATAYVAEADRPDGVHPFAARNGPDVEDRLRQTSLYRPDLDLVVVTEADECGGYALCWYDPVTRVGLVEPMRTEEDHQRRGLARHLLTSGLRPDPTDAHLRPATPSALRH